MPDKLEYAPPTFPLHRERVKGGDVYRIHKGKAPAIPDGSQQGLEATICRLHSQGFSVERIANRLFKTRNVDIDGKPIQNDSYRAFCSFIGVLVEDE